MRKHIVLLLSALLLFGYGCHNKNKYADLPPELAELCLNIDKHPKKPRIITNGQTTIT